MDTQISMYGYSITTDPGFQNEHFKNTSELAGLLETLYLESQDKKNKKIIGRLTALILKYPQSPQLKNFLSVAYSVQGNYKKAMEVNRWILAEHPDYLFAKINRAHEYISNGEPEKVPEVLGDAMEIKALYPERDLFHLVEVTGFYKVAIRYYAAIKNYELAENRFEVLEKIAPNHHDTEAALSFLYASRLGKAMDRWRQKETGEIEVECVRPVPVSMPGKPPDFNHHQIKNLYEHGLRIPAELLREILMLPRQTLIADLEKTLQDAVDRYCYFSNLEDDDEETLSFPLHAICLLAELKAESSLPVILDFLENHPDLLDFWLGDHLTSTLWLPIYLLSQNSLHLLKQFLIKPGVHTYSKGAVSEAIGQMALQQPERKNEIVATYTEVFAHFSKAALTDNLIDSAFLGMAVGDIIDAGLEEMMPIIKELFDKKYVSTEINGGYEEVTGWMAEPGWRKEKKEIQDIFELYKTITTTWGGYLEEDDDDEEDFDRDIDMGFDEDDFFDEYEEVEQPVVSVKIGRNEPCPCGSGKKYKKCCIDKVPV